MTEYIISVAGSNCMKEYCRECNKEKAISIAKSERKKRVGSVFLIEVKTQRKNITF